MNGNELADILGERKEWPERYWEQPLFRGWLEETPRKVAGKEWRTRAYREWMETEQAKLYKASQPLGLPPRRLEAMTDLEKWDRQVEAWMQSKEYKSYSIADQAKFQTQVATHREKLVKAQELKEEKEKGWPVEEAFKLIDAYKGGEISSAKLMIGLRGLGVSEDFMKIVQEETETEREKAETQKEQIEAETAAQEFVSKAQTEEGFTPIDLLEYRDRREEWIAKLDDDKKRWEKEFGAERADAMFDQEMRRIEYEDEKVETNRRYKLDVEKFGEETAQNKLNYDLDKLKEKHNWEGALFNMGFKNKEFIESANQFYTTLSFNQEKEKTRAEEFGVTYERLIERDANAMREFEEKQKLEYKRLDLETEELGLTKDIEARIKMMALLNFNLNVQKFGLDQTIHQWEKTKADKNWYFKEQEIALKQVNAAASFITTMDKIIGNARESKDIWKVTSKFLRDSLGESIMDVVDVIQEKGEEQIEISPELATDLNTLGEETKNKVIGYLTASYNPKTKRVYKPNVNESNELSEFVLGKADIKPKDLELEKLGCNLSTSEYIEAVLKEPFWSEGLKGLCIRMRYDSDIWSGVQNRAKLTQVLIIPEEEIEKGPGFLGRFTEAVKGGLGLWWPFGKKEEVTTVTPTERDIRKDLEEILTEQGKISRAEVRRLLMDKGYSNLEINTLLGE